MNYTVSDIIIRIKNAAMAGRKTTILPLSKFAKNILEVLKKEGFISSFREDKALKTLTVEIVYINRMPALNEVKIISRPSIRVYKDKKGLENKRSKGIKTTIISTSKGVMTTREAIEKSLGGEILFEIW